VVELPSIGGPLSDSDAFPAALDLGFLGCFGLCFGFVFGVGLTFAPEFAGALLKSLAATTAGEVTDP